MLWDMLNSARNAIEFTEDLEYKKFLDDKRTRLAVERSLEIVGEAARGVSRATQSRHPDIPWRSIIGLRHLLAHEYDEIRYEIIWRICREKAPELVRILVELGVDAVPEEDEEEIQS